MIRCETSRHDPRTADGRPVVTSGLRLCWSCRDDIVRYTQQALDRHRDGLERQAWGSGTSYEPRVDGSHERQLVIDPSTVARRTEIEHVIGAWARLVIDTRGRAPISEVDLDEYRVHGRLSIAARIVMTSATWLAAHELAVSCREELRGLVVREPRPAAAVFVGRCPECAAPCTAQTGGDVACSAVDEHRWPIHEVGRRWLAAGVDRMLVTAEAAVLLGVSVDSVRQLAAAGRLTRYGTPRRATFDPGEVAHLHGQLWAEAAA